MASDEFKAGSVDQMKTLFDRLKEIGGKDWHEKLAKEMTTEDKKDLRKSLEGHEQPLTEPRPAPSGNPLTEPHPAPGGRPPLTEPAPPPSGKPLNG